MASNSNSNNKKTICNDLSFVTWCTILLEAAVIRWVHSGHKGIDMVGKNTKLGCDI